MSFNPSSPVTGAAVTGLTSPTYSLTSDLAPGNNSKQFVVLAIGGTQTGVDVHTVSKPFTTAFFRPQNLRTIGSPNPVTGIIKDIPSNIYKHVTRKGAVPYANQPAKNVIVTTTIEVPAGVETYESEEVAAALSLHYGIGFAEASNIFSTVKTGTI